MESVDKYEMTLFTHPMGEGKNLSIELDNRETLVSVHKIDNGTYKVKAHPELTFQTLSEVISSYAMDTSREFMLLDQYLSLIENKFPPSVYSVHPEKPAPIAEILKEAQYHAFLNLHQPEIGHHLYTIGKTTAKEILRQFEELVIQQTISCVDGLLDRYKKLLIKFYVETVHDHQSPPTSENHIDMRDLLVLQEKLSHLKSKINRNEFLNLEEVYYVCDTCNLYSKLKEMTQPEEEEAGHACGSSCIRVFAHQN